MARILSGRADESVSWYARPRHPETSVRTLRYPIVDMLRGVAIVLMFAYHFTFDLAYFGALRIDFNHEAFWLAFRTLIVSAFLGLVGVSLVLAGPAGGNPKAYFARLGRIGGCAALVTIGSWLMFPQSYIFFGVLHFILVASVLGLPFVRLFWTNLFLGSALIIIGVVYHHRFFEHSWMQWFGLMSFKPMTEDYVPLLPWFGVVLIGIFSARLILSRPLREGLAAWRPGSRGTRLLTFAGRHSLLIYMVHQPVFLGVMYPLFLVSRSLGG
jgi:uncharacterized membrane protein